VKVLAQFLTAASDARHFPVPGPPEIAFLGRSNVGKSSVINSLLGTKIARTSSTPGRTRSINFFTVRWPGRPKPEVIFTDLPGYGYAKVPKSMMASWRVLVNAYLEEAEALRLMFLLLDARRTPADYDKQMHHWTKAAGIDERVVLTKSDKLSNNQLAKSKTAIARELEIDTAAMIPASAVTKQGVDQVRREIVSRL